MQVNSNNTHRTETTYITPGSEAPPFNNAHLAHRQAILGMKVSSSSSASKYIYIPDPPQEGWQITQIYLSFVKSDVTPMTFYDGPVSIVSRSHVWSIATEATPAMSTLLTEHLATTATDLGTNRWLTLSTKYNPRTRYGSYLVAHVNAPDNDAIFMGGSYMIARIVK